MFPPKLTADEQKKLIDYYYARLQRPMRIRVEHKADGHYSIYDEDNKLVHLGWLAGGGSLEQRNAAAAANLRESSQVAFDAPAIQRLFDLMDFGKAKPRVTLAGLIIPDKQTDEGVLISSVSFVWIDIVKKLSGDWSKAHEIPEYV